MHEVPLYQEKAAFVNKLETEDHKGHTVDIAVWFIYVRGSHT